MEEPEVRPGIKESPTLCQRLANWKDAGRRGLVRGRERARSWPFTARLAWTLGATVAFIAMAFALDGVLQRLAAICWLLFIGWQAACVLRQIHPQDEEVFMEHAHGAQVTEFTLRSGLLERDEIVSYDERPHWGYAVKQLFQVSCLVAAGVVVTALLTPWFDIPFIMVIFKVLAVAGGVYWLGRQEAEFLWTHYIITDKYAHVLTRPPAIFGDERRFSLNLAKIETRNIHRPMVFRLLGMDMGHLQIDAPGQNDKRFNALQWVRHPQEFHGHLKPGTAVPLPRRRWRRRS